MSPASEEKLQAFLDGALSPAENEEVEAALASSPELREQARELRELMADCSYMFAAVSDIDARRLMRKPEQSARTKPGMGWMRRAAAFLIVVGSGAALWTVFDRTGARADVDTVAVTVPGARQIASAVDVVDGERIRTSRFALASGATMEIAIVGERSRSVLRGAPDSQVRASRTSPHIEATENGSLMSWTDPSGYVVRVTADIPPDELRQLADQIVLSRQN